MQRQIGRAEDLLDDFEPRDGFYLADETVARYLNTGLVHAQTIDRVAQGGRSYGTEPSRRMILEVHVDLLWLLTVEDLEEVAAWIVVWEILDSDRYIREVEQPFREAVLPPDRQIQPEPFRQLSLDRVEDKLRRAGQEESLALLRDTYVEHSGDDVPYHWTRKSGLHARARSLEGRIQKDVAPEPAEVVSHVAQRYWTRLSMMTHPRPGWVPPTYWPPSAVEDEGAVAAALSPAASWLRESMDLAQMLLRRDA